MRIVFRHLPLPFHEWARPAAELSEIVRAQRGDAAFWAFHDLVYAHRAEIDEAEDPREALLALAGQVRGVSVARARASLAAPPAD